MPIYSVFGPDQDQMVLTDRLSQLISLEPIEMGVVKQKVKRGDIFLLSGVALDGLEAKDRGDMLEYALCKGGHVLVYPPHPPESLDWRIPGIDAISFKSSEYSPIKILNEELNEIAGNRDFNILFNTSIIAGPGKVIAISSNRDTVVTSYQHRSSWGILICTTLLITSTSIRSPRLERSIFLKSLINWLQSLTTPDVSIENSEQKKAFLSDLEISIMLIGLYLTHQNGQVNKQLLIPKINRIQISLQNQEAPFKIDEALNQLEPLIFKTPVGPVFTIDLDQLTNEINKRRLWSYLRRLK